MGARDEAYSAVLLILTFGCCMVFAFDIMPRARAVLESRKKRRQKAMLAETMTTLARKTSEFMVFGGLYMVLTIALIYVNAWIMDSLFPYAATLTLCQMVFCVAASGSCIFGLKLAEVPEFVNVKFWANHFLSLGLMYAVYLWGSNLSYKYLEVGFVQMIKPLGGFLIYATLVYRGFEKLTAWKVVNVCAIFGGISIASCGQNELGAFSWVGFGVLVASLVANAFYYTLLQFVLQPSPEDGTREEVGTNETPSCEHKKAHFKLNPLTTMFLVGPASALWLVVVAACTEWGSPKFAWTLPVWVLLVDCALAFLLNLAIMYMLKAFSALTYSLCGYVKDVVVVALSVVVVDERVSSLQWRAYAVMLFGQALWMSRKIDEQFIEAHHRKHAKKSLPHDYYGPALDDDHDTAAGSSTTGCAGCDDLQKLILDDGFLDEHDDHIHPLDQAHATSGESVALLPPAPPSLSSS